MYECYRAVSNENVQERLQTYCWHIVQMEMSLLDTLSVVSLRVGKTKETLLEEGTDG